MAKYSSHVVQVDAVQWDGTPEGAETIVRPHGYIMTFVDGDDLDGPHIRIDAGGSGSCRALAGEWIIRHPRAGYAVLSNGMFNSLFSLCFGEEPSKEL